LTGSGGLFFVPFIRPAWTAAVMCLALILLAACDRAPSAESPLRIDAIGSRAAGAIVAEALAAGLTARDAHGQIIPGLAQSWRVSDDGLSIVLRLRAAQYSDGRPILAEDVVSTLEAARKANNLTADLLAGVTGISAPLGDTIELRLSTPQPELLELLATPPLAIRAVRHPDIFAGPYIALTPAGEKPAHVNLTDLYRNQRYYAVESVKVAAASVRQAAGRDAVGRFQRGESDLVSGGRLEGFADARTLGRRATLLIEQPRELLLLLVNHQHEALADLRVRRALSLAIDRERLGATLFANATVPGVYGLTPDSRLPAISSDPLPMRQAEARELLAAAGVELPLRLAVAISQSSADADTVSAVAADLAAIGIELTLVRRSPAGHARAIKEGDFVLALTSHISPIDSPLPFLLPFRCDANRFGVCNPEADQLLSDAWVAPGLAERRAAWEQAELLWRDDIAAIGLVRPLAWTLLSPRITGFEVNASGVHRLSMLAVLPERYFR